MCYETANKISSIRTSIQFIKEGNISKISQRNRHKPTWLDSCMDWRVIADIDWQLAFPTEITFNRQHPDLVIWSVNSKKVIIAELMILLRSTLTGCIRINWKSTETCSSSVLRMGGQQTYLHLRLDVEVLFRIQTLHFSPAEKRVYIKKIQNKTVTASEQIWQSYR